MEASSIVDIMTRRETQLATGMGALPAFEKVVRLLRGEWLAKLFGSDDLTEEPRSRAPWLADECALEHLYEVIADKKDR